MKRILLYLMLLSGLCLACKKEATVPEKFTYKAVLPVIWPDYTLLTIPPNIAPMNFRVKTEAEAAIVQVTGGGKEIIVAGDDKNTIQFPATSWSSLLAASKGDAITFILFTKDKEGAWTRWQSYANYVAKEEIDPYLSYRLIEPGYELYRQLGIYQRNLSTFEETPIYENNREYDIKDNHCINCHTYQNRKTENMLFHVRQAHGGTIIAQGDKIKKVNLKTDSTLSAGVYPAWHPTLNKIAFSVNKTGQSFHLIGQTKVEVLDEASDLIIYDVDKDEVTPICKTPDLFETFPTWNKAGDTLFYCAAKPDITMAGSDSTGWRRVIARYDSVYYDLMAMPYDIQTNTFGTPNVIFPASQINKSITLPRVSPDGRYLLFTMGDFGQFHIWHKSSDLYVIDFYTKSIRPLSKANSPDVDSYHSWSSNGRWIVFSSRRDDGSYTRPYFTYFNEKGGETKPFILPVENPEEHTLRLKSYNIPELTVEPVRITPGQFKEVIYNSEAKKVSLKQ